MISTISFRDHEVVLRTTREDREKIYDADSLSLIIGKNGSGKTQFLKGVVNAVSLGNTIDMQNDCRINFFRDADTDLKKWGCVYYTPVPFQPEFKRRKRFANASLKGKPDIDIKEIYQHKEIVAAFGIELNVSAVAKNNIKKIIDNLIELSLQPDLKSRRKITDFWQKFPGYHRLQEFDSKKEENEPFREMSGSFTQRAYIKNDLYEDVLDYLVGKFPTNELLAYFILTGDLRNVRESSRDRLVSLLFLTLFGDYDKSEFEKNYKREASRVNNDLQSIKKFIDYYFSDFSFYHQQDFVIPLDDDNDWDFLNRHNVSPYFSFQFENMSSGQLAVIHQLLSISAAVKKLADTGLTKILLLVDEGDAFLHLEWQRLYICQLNSLLKYLKSACRLDRLQVILTTHSPMLATDVPRDFICALDYNKETSYAFASPMHAIVSESFGSSTMGRFATEKINTAFERFADRKPQESDFFIVKSIDNLVLKKEFERLFGDRLHDHFNA